MVKYSDFTLTSTFSIPEFGWVQDLETMSLHSDKKMLDVDVREGMVH